MEQAQAVEAPPNKPLRLMIVDFTIVFLPNACCAWNYFSLSRPARQVGARNRTVEGAKPFWGTHETRLKQNWRTDLNNKGVCNAWGLK
jgi:hypothetical protein